ncbi:hypothetical protein V2J09_022158 [Rumex salicifolius]
MRYRKFQPPIRRPVAVTEQSLDIPLNSSQPLMSQILGALGIPSRIGEQMADHFRFFADRLARRIHGGGGGGGSEIPISVRLDVKFIPPETAVGIRTRMESARASDAAAPRRRREEAEEEPVPARRSSIEALEKVRVCEEGGGYSGGRECAVCLEELRVGVEAARMPCGHLYHWDCIAEWLQRTHFCPFCRFKMPPCS